MNKEKDDFILLKNLITKLKGNLVLIPGRNDESAILYVICLEKKFSATVKKAKPCY